MIASSCLVCGARIPPGTSKCDTHSKQRHAIPGACVVCGARTHFLYCDDHRPQVDESKRAAYRKGYRDPAYYRERQAAITRAKGACERCGRADLKLECDHRVPLRDGGTNTRDNLWMLCPPCHVRKTGADRRSRRDR